LNSKSGIPAFAGMTGRRCSIVFLPHAVERADAGCFMTVSWILTLPCTRQEAEALHEDVDWLALLDPMPSVVAEEVEPFNDAKWRLKAYFPEQPGKTVIAAIQKRVPSAAAAKPVVEQLPDEDWLVLSQQGLQPVHAGRFYVHTSSNKGSVPAGAIPFLIEASRAFGTGGHETTSGCLAMLDRMKRQGKRFDLIADIGTGTGLLAFAAHHLWPRAYLAASDIDPVSIEVTADNAVINNIPLGHSFGRLALCVASGTDHMLIQQRAPYDLVIANILAGPLIELAPSLAEIMQDGGSLILAGLLDTQTNAVLRTYRAQGFRLQRREDTGDWPCLWLVKRNRHGWQRPRRAVNHTSQPPGDFGTW
jgi:ribosomal protein L11 methyltransferase